MIIKVLYHSMTGNTKKLALAIADELHVSAEPIGDGGISSPVDLLFIGDGIYAGKIHKRTRALIEQLDPAMVKNVAIFATYGGQAKIGADMKQLVEEKGVQVVGEPFVCKGQSWWLINRNHPDDRDIADVREYAKLMASTVNMVSGHEE